MYLLYSLYPLYSLYSSYSLYISGLSDIGVHTNSLNVCFQVLHVWVKRVIFVIADVVLVHMVHTHEEHCYILNSNQIWKKREVHCRYTRQRHFCGVHVLSLDSSRLYFPSTTSRSCLVYFCFCFLG